MIETLKPCPFCGDTSLNLTKYDRITTIDGETVKVHSKFLIHCQSCGLLIESTDAGVSEASRKALISQWNTRFNSQEK